MKTQAMTHNWFERMEEQFEKSRFGAMTILMTAQSCFSAIAAMYSLQQHNYVLLGFSSFTAMASNSAFIAQASARWCLRVFYVTVLINAAVIAINCIA